MAEASRPKIGRSVSSAPTGSKATQKKERFTGRIKIPGSSAEIPFTGRIIRVAEDGARIASLVDINLDDLLALLEATVA